MAAKGISIRILAEKTGLSYCYVSNLISGSKVSKIGLHKIIEALGMKEMISDLDPETTNQEEQHAQTKDS